MKKSKAKAIYILALIFCMMTAFSLKAKAAAYTSKVSHISSNCKTIGIAFTYQSNCKYEVVLYNSAKKELKRGICSDYIEFKNLTAKNKVYYYSSRLLQYDRSSAGNENYIAATDWTEKKPFTTISKYTFKTKSRKNRTKSLKAPKIAGVQYYTVYLSTKSLTGYKKAYTVKPGKTVTLSKYNKKKFSWGKIYYVRVIPKVNKLNAEGTYYYGKFRFYKIYTVI